MSDRPDLKWGVERRLEFIEFRLFWEGGVNRSDIIEKFDVSVPQASKDLTLYQERAPGNVEYDKSAKRYIASGDFNPIYLNPDPDSYLSRLKLLAEGLSESSESWITQAPATDIALTPKRDVDTAVLRGILTAVRELHSIDIKYQSMSANRPDPIWRTVTPHAFGYDGFRWHARAYCHLTNEFKDFLLPRILEVGSTGESGAKAADDRLWHERFVILIGPHPKLTESQQAVVAKDYGMRDGVAKLDVRYSMLFYVLKRLGLLGDGSNADPRQQHIVVINQAETSEALKQAGFAT